MSLTEESIKSFKGLSEDSSSDDSSVEAFEESMEEGSFAEASFSFPQLPKKVRDKTRMSNNEMILFVITCFLYCLSVPKSTVMDFERWKE